MKKINFDNKEVWEKFCYFFRTEKGYTDWTDDEIEYSRCEDDEREFAAWLEDPTGWNDKEGKSSDGECTAFKDYLARMIRQEEEALTNARNMDAGDRVIKAIERRLDSFRQDAACWLKADLTGSLYSNKVIN